MAVDLIALANKSKRHGELRSIPVFSKERHEEAMRIATAPRNPKYWNEVNEISKKIINEVGVA